ncbi:MAG: hypothetical protein IBX61_04005 [Thermoleophilia bacterium]|nr:hypothetical protein [Thermoleophilia bacterium]
MASGKKAGTSNRKEKGRRKGDPLLTADRSTELLIDLTIASLILAIVVLVYSISMPVVADSRWSVHTAMSVIKEGNINLNEYRQVLAANNYYMIENHEGNLYNRFPIGVSLMVVPLVFIYDRFAGLGEVVKTTIPSEVELYAASIIVAAAGIFIFLIGKKCTGKRWQGLLLAAVFAFATSAWSTAGLALWQHGPTMLMLSAALYLILLARERPALIQLAALPLSFSFIVRPTNAIPIVLFSIYVFLEHRRYFLRYALLGILLALPFLALNYSIYGQLVSPYYSPDRLGTTSGIPRFLVGLAGTTISPGRGLFLFSPVLLLSLAGIYLKVRSRRFYRLDYFLAAIILLHWFSISSVMQWWGGHSYGPRFFADMIPFFIYFLIPVFERISSLKSRLTTSAAWSLVAVLVLFSVFVQFRGATCSQVQSWNVRPEIHENRERLWDYGDISYLSGIGDNLFRWHEKCFADDAQFFITLQP